MLQMHIVYPVPELSEGREALLSPLKAAVTHFAQAKIWPPILHQREMTLVLLQRLEILCLCFCLIREVAGSFSH